MVAFAETVYSASISSLRRLRAQIDVEKESDVVQTATAAAEHLI